MISDLAVVILTRNETLHLERAIASVKPIAKQIFVIDSFSDDGTQELARKLGAIVLENRFVSHARQFAWALDHAPITAEWILRLDADEIIEPDLQREIAKRLPELPADVAGVLLNRRHIFMERWIRHGGRYPLQMLRIWRRGQGRVEDRWMDEHVVVWGGRTVAFAGGFSDHNLKDLSFFTAKHNGYATREAVQVLMQRHSLLTGEDPADLRGGPKQASQRRILKERVYNKLPFWVGPFGYFLYRYFLQLGFLDGREGLIYHFLQGCWYRFLVAAKIEEFERVLAATPEHEKRSRLAALSGLQLDARSQATDAASTSSGIAA